MAALTTAVLISLRLTCRLVRTLSGSQYEAFSFGLFHSHDINGSEHATLNGTVGENCSVRRPRSFSRRCTHRMGAIHRGNNVEADVYPRNLRKHTGKTR